MSIPAGTKIVMIDYVMPLEKRKRGVCGPYYRIVPPIQERGRCGFYHASKGMKMDRAGSSFRLRFQEASDLLPSTAYRLRHIEGYYCDDHGDQTMVPIVARLPKRRGFLVGWTMGNGMWASLDDAIHYNGEEDAARAAHEDARIAAEIEQEYQREEEERLQA